MASATILAHCAYASEWLELACDAERFLAEARQTPDIIYLVGGCEGHILELSAGRNLLGRMLGNAPNAQARLVYQGCVGFFGAVADFQLSEAECAIVVCDESSELLSRRCLAIAGVGIGTPGGGMLAMPGMGLAVLQRKRRPGPHDITLSDLRIYAQPGGIEGTTTLLRKMHRVYDSFEAAGERCVSFAIHSPWSDALLKDLAPKAPRRAWLPSAEQGRNHLMSLKPMLEIATYAERLADGPIGIITLGLGGRIGVVRIARGGAGKGRLGDIPVWRPQIAPPRTLPNEPSKAGRPSALKVLDALEPRFAGIDGLYFRAELLPQACTPVGIATLADASTALSLRVQGIELGHAE